MAARSPECRPVPDIAPPAAHGGEETPRMNAGIAEDGAEHGRDFKFWILNFGF